MAVTMRDLLEAGIHFGHQTHRWNPKMSRYIFGERNGIAFLSEQTTLLPGTVILTGTPSGIGWARTPRRMLQAGDVVSVTIDGIGTLTNNVVQG